MKIIHCDKIVSTEENFQKCPLRGRQALNKQAALISNAVTFDSFI